MKREETLRTLWLLWTLELAALWLLRLLYFRTFDNEVDGMFALELCQHLLDII